MTERSQGPPGDVGSKPEIGLFFPVMVVAANLGIMISLIVLPTLDWWSLVVIGALAFLGLGSFLGYQYLQSKTRKDGPL